MSTTERPARGPEGQPKVLQDAPHPDAQGREVVQLRTKGLSQEQQNGLLAWAESVWGDDLIVSGSLDEGGTMTVSVPKRADVAA